MGGFDDYALADGAAVGASGAVSWARHVATGQAVAVTELSSAAASDNAYLARLRATTAALTKVGHPNVLAIREVVEGDGRVWVVEDWVDGRELGDVLDDGRLTAEQSVALTEGVLRGLVAVHGKDVVHGDVSTASIVVTADGVPRLIGFGFAGMPGRPPVDADADVLAVATVFRDLLAGGARHPRLEAVVEKATSARPKDRPNAATLLAQVEKAARSDFGKGWEAKPSLAQRAVPPPPAAVVEADEDEPESDELDEVDGEGEADEPELEVDDEPGAEGADVDEAEPEPDPALSAEPDAAEPDAAEPDAAGPDAAEPDAAGPDAAEPDAAEPDAAGPDAAEPDVTGEASSGQPAEPAEPAEPADAPTPGDDTTSDSELAADTDIADGEAAPSDADAEPADPDPTSGAIATQDVVFPPEPMPTAETDGDGAPVSEAETTLDVTLPSEKVQADEKAAPPPAAATAGKTTPSPTKPSSKKAKANRARTGPAATAPTKTGPPKTGPPSTAPVAPAPTAAPGQKPPRRGVVWGLAAVIIILIGAGAAVALDRNQTDDQVDQAAATGPGVTFAPGTPQASEVATLAEIANADIIGAWNMRLAVFESSGFFGTQVGQTVTKTYTIKSDCSSTPCALKLAVSDPPSEFDLRRQPEEYLVTVSGPQDCIVLATGQLVVANAGIASVTVHLRPTSASRTPKGGWTATGLSGSVVTTFDTSHPDCVQGSGVQRSTAVGTRQ